MKRSIILFIFAIIITFANNTNILAVEEVLPLPACIEDFRNLNNQMAQILPLEQKYFPLKIDELYQLRQKLRQKKLRDLQQIKLKKQLVSISSIFPIIVELFSFFQVLSFMCNSLDCQNSVAAYYISAVTAAFTGLGLGKSGLSYFCKIGTDIETETEERIKFLENNIGKLDLLIESMEVETIFADAYDISRNPFFALDETPATKKFLESVASMYKITIYQAAKFLTELCKHDNILRSSRNLWTKDGLLSLFGGFIGDQHVSSYYHTIKPSGLRHTYHNLPSQFKEQYSRLYFVPSNINVSQLFQEFLNVAKEKDSSRNNTLKQIMIDLLQSSEFRRGIPGENLRMMPDTFQAPIEPSNGQ